MAFNINDLRSQLTFGGAKSTLFQVQITNPIVGGIADIKVPFMVKASIIPSSTINSIDVSYFGRKIKVAGDRTFEPWRVTVINDEDFLIRNAMEAWMSAINTHEGNLSAVGPVQYKAQAQITQFSKSGVPLRVYNFNGLFPTEVAAMNMSWEDNDRIEEFDVTFAYDWWNVSGGVTGDGGTNV